MRLALSEEAQTGFLKRVVRAKTQGVAHTGNILFTRR
jgi:tRNA A58 N-methylase Trm61